MLMKSLKTAVSLTLFLAVCATVAHGKVYHSRQEALQIAFPAADTVETVNLYLTDEEMKRVSRAAATPVDSALYSFYVGKKDGRIIGYAAIEAAVVRTLPETVIVVLDPGGTVRFVEVLAFFEPEEYKPSTRWLDQLRGKKLDENLRVGGDIQALSGATLSAQAITRQTRKSAALLNLLLERKR